MGRFGLIRLQSVMWCKMEERGLATKGRQLLSTEENRFIGSEILKGYPAQDMIRVNIISASLEYQ